MRALLQKKEQLIIIHKKSQAKPNQTQTKQNKTKQIKTY